MRLVILILLSLFPALAYAAPVLIWAGVAVTTAYAVQAVVMIAMAVYGAAQQRKASREARSEWYSGLRDRTITSVASDNPYVYVYGRAMVGGTVVGMFNEDTSGVVKYAVVVLAAHECDAIEEVYIAGHPVGYSTLDGSGNVAVGSYYYPPVTSYISEAPTVSATTFVIPHRSLIGSITATRFIGNPDSIYAIDYVPIPNITIDGTPVVGLPTYYEAGAVVTIVGDTWQVVDTVNYVFPLDFPRVRIRTHLGTVGQTADADLMAATPTLWKSTATLNGFCYLVVRMHLAQAEFQLGMPQVTALVRGKKLYDPRSSTTAWSQNPALVAYDYLTSPICGKISSADLPVADYIAAANVCDEDHSVDSTLPAIFGKRYTFNGTITADQQQHDTLEVIAQSMAGAIVATTWSISAGKYVAPVMALYQEDIVGSVGLSPGTSDMQLFNGVKGRFSGSENNYAATDFTPYQNVSFLATDGIAKWTNIDFPFTDNTIRIQNLASIFTAAQRYAYTFKAEFSLKTWPLQVGDRVTMTSSTFGWAAKVFLITDKKYTPNSAVELTLKEDDPVIWQVAAQDIQTYAIPQHVTSFGLPYESVIGSISIINNGIVVPPTIYDVLGTLVIGSLTTYQAGAVVNLNSDTGANDFTCIYEAPGSPVVPAGALVETNIPNPYLIDKIASIALSSGNNDLLFMADGTVVSRIHATWPVSTTQSVLSGGQIEIQLMLIGSGVWHSFFATGDATEMLLNPVQDGQLYQVRIRAFNPTVNAYSDWTYATPHLVLGKSIPPDDVAGFSNVFEPFGITLSWTANTDPDLGEYEIRLEGANWATSTLVTNTKSTHYFTKPIASGDTTYRIKAIDTSGNYSVNSSTMTVTVTVPSTPSPSVVVAGQNSVISWAAVTGSFAIDHYEIRYGASWSVGTVLDKTYTGTFTEKISYAGTRTYWVAAVDVAGNTGSAASAAMPVSNPSAPSITATTIGTSVILSWTDATSTLPIDHYIVRYGATYAGGVPLTSNPTQLKAQTISQVVNFGGSRTYWVAAVDTAGNVGTAASVVYTVSNPNAPTMSATTLGWNVTLSWTDATSTLPIDHYSLRYGSAYLGGTDLTASPTQLAAHSFTQNVTFVGSRTYWIVAIDTAGNASTPASVTYTVSNPNAPSLSVSSLDGNVILSWTDSTSTLPIDHYSLRYGSSYAAGNDLTPSPTQMAAHSFTQSVNYGGSRTYWIIAVDTAGNSSTPVSATLAVANPNSPSMLASVSGGDVTLSWVAAASTLPIDHYSLRYGSTYAGGTELTLNPTQMSALSFTQKVNYSGTRTYWIVAVDIAGNVSAPYSNSVTITNPAAVSMTAQVIDNNILLYWTDSLRTLPIVGYEIRRGTVYSSATVIGTKQGLFTALFETIAGTFTYWVTGIDSAGNYGTPTSLGVTVNQPPDYVFRGNFNSTFSGTMSNALHDANAVTMPVNLTETYAQHFSGHSWASPADQVSAGYPIYIQPSLSPGYYEETFDFGAVLGSNKINLSYLGVALAGTPVITTIISASPDNATWTAYPGVTSVYATGFRYVKVRITATAGLGDLYSLTSLNVRVDSKLVNDAGSLAVVSTDTGGTVATFNVPFLDVTSINVTPLSTSAAYCVYDFAGGANPASFKILLFNSAGTRISGTVSWTARGH